MPDAAFPARRNVSVAGKRRHSTGHHRGLETPTLQPASSRTLSRIAVFLVKTPSPTRSDRGFCPPCSARTMQFRLVNLPLVVLRPMLVPVTIVANTPCGIVDATAATVARVSAGSPRFVRILYNERTPRPSTAVLLFSSEVSVTEPYFFVLAAMPSASSPGSSKDDR